MSGERSDSEDSAEGLAPPTRSKSLEYRPVVPFPAVGDHVVRAQQPRHHAVLEEVVRAVELRAGCESRFGRPNHYVQDHAYRALMSWLPSGDSGHGFYGFGSKKRPRGAKGPRKNASSGRNANGWVDARRCNLQALAAHATQTFGMVRDVVAELTLLAPAPQLAGRPLSWCVLPDLLLSPINASVLHGCGYRPRWQRSHQCYVRGFGGAMGEGKHGLALLALIDADVRDERSTDHCTWWRVKDAVQRVLGWVPRYNSLCAADQRRVPAYAVATALVASAAGWAAAFTGFAGSSAAYRAHLEAHLLTDACLVACRAFTQLVPPSEYAREALALPDIALSGEMFLEGARVAANVGLVCDAYTRTATAVAEAIADEFHRGEKMFGEDGADSMLLSGCRLAGALTEMCEVYAERFEGVATALYMGGEESRQARSPQNSQNMAAQAADMAADMAADTAADTAAQATAEDDEDDEPLVVSKSLSRKADDMKRAIRRKADPDAKYGARRVSDAAFPVAGPLADELSSMCNALANSRCRETSAEARACRTAIDAQAEIYRSRVTGNAPLAPLYAPPLLALCERVLSCTDPAREDLLKRRASAVRVLLALRMAPHSLHNSYSTYQHNRPSAALARPGTIAPAMQTRPPLRCALPFPYGLAALGPPDEAQLVALRHAWRALFDKVHGALVRLHKIVGSGEHTSLLLSGSLRWETELLTRVPHPEVTSCMGRVGLFMSIASSLGRQTREHRPPVLLAAPMLDGDDTHWGQWHLEDMRRLSPES